MSTTTPVLGLNLWEADDRFSFRALNRDNEALEAALAALVSDKAVVSAAARISAYNTMNIVRNSADTINNTVGIFGGYYTTPATAASAEAWFDEDRYRFGYEQTTSLEHNAAGDAVTSVPSTSRSFTFTAPVSGLLKTITVDTARVIRVTVRVGDNSGTVKISDYFDDYATRAVRTLTLSSEVPVVYGDEITVSMQGASSTTASNAYGVADGQPYMVLGVTPAPQSGWLETGLSDIRDFGHTEANAYILANLTDADTVTATLTDGNGHTVELSQADTTETDCPQGAACKEIHFKGPYTAKDAKLTIGITAGENSNALEVFGYGVTFI